MKNPLNRTMGDTESEEQKGKKIKEKWPVAKGPMNTK